MDKERDKEIDKGKEYREREDRDTKKRKKKREQIKNIHIQDTG